MDGKTSYCRSSGIYICMPYVHNPESRECTEDFTQKEVVVLKPAIDKVDSLNDEENGFRF